MSSLIDLKQRALEAMKFSYSPYSQKKIGAAVKLSNGQVFSGCNIENASYGGTVCAERVAIWKAFSENPSTVKISEVTVASEAAEPWPPCGFCRQVIAEFASADTLITLVNTNGVEQKMKFSDLFPSAFGPGQFE